MTASHAQVASHALASPLEVAGVAAIAIAVWRAALGWDWTWSANGTVRTPPQSTLDWAVLGATAMIAVGWLGLRGRAVSGTVAVCLPIVALSGWRMAAAAILDWPIGLAALVFTLSATCMAAAVFGAGLRRLHSGRS